MPIALVLFVDVCVPVLVLVLVCVCCSANGSALPRQGMTKRPMRVGRKQRDLGKEMGSNSPLSIKAMLAKM